MGENHFSSLPTAAYGFILLLAGVAYLILQTTIIRNGAMRSEAAAALRRDVKGTASTVLYSGAFIIAFFAPAIACAIYAAVAIMWLIPDTRIERALRHSPPRSVAETEIGSA